jgi:ferrochelatase
MQLSEHVAARGGELRAIPCLNASPGHADALAARVQRELEAWA